MSKNWRTLPRAPGGGRKPKWGKLGTMVRINARWPEQVKAAMIEKYGSEQVAIDELIIKQHRTHPAPQPVSGVGEREGGRDDRASLSDLRHQTTDSR